MLRRCEASLNTLRATSSVDEQILSLRLLKNDIVGHDQRKEVVVRHGLVESLGRILRNGARTGAKRSLNEANGYEKEAPLNKENEAKLQAIFVVGSLATSGPGFVSPLLAGDIVDCLLDILDDPSSRLLVASLQALRSLAASWAQYDGLELDSRIPERIFTRSSMESLLGILKQPLWSMDARREYTLVCQIITDVSVTETVRDALKDAGFLETLATKLVDCADPDRAIDQSNSLIIPCILDAVSAIVQPSHHRAYHFIFSPTLEKFFGANASLTAHEIDEAMCRVDVNILLPEVAQPVHKSVSFHSGSSAFPALGSLRTSPSQQRFVLNTAASSDESAHAASVFNWLMLIVRNLRGAGRLAALRLLSLVNVALDVQVMGASYRSEAMIRSRERERQMSLLAVPLAVKLVQDSATPPYEIETSSEAQERKAVKEQACAMLANIIGHNKELHSAAADSGAVKYLCPLLKKSFDTVTLAKPMWSAKPEPSEISKAVPTRMMGNRGLPPEIIHALKCRRGALVAISAICNKEDTHRKAVIEAGVITYIIDSLIPFPDSLAENLSSPNAARNQPTITARDGNTRKVLLAACQAAASMSRSVSLLRTSLIDAGIARPMFALLSYPEIAIQVAATDVCANLLLDFSPMREDLLQAGVIKTLTNHARRSSPELRLSSLWALKHLVLNAPKEVKITCLEELGTGWLTQAIAGDSRNDTSASGPAAMSTPNAAGEQVDLLNPSDMDVDQSDNDDLEDDEDDISDGEVMYDDQSGTRYQASQLRSTLKPLQSDKSRLQTVRELEYNNPQHRAKHDDIQIQEQALDFLRNLINGEDSAVMIDHLMATMGTAKLFELLHAKLAPVRSASSSASSSRPLYQPPELILGAIHVLTHVAGASPKHRQLIIAQRPLLQAWLPHFQHADRRIRVMSVWITNNLTWIEDESDRANARGRAQELRAMGIEDAIRSMVNDCDLDVRERVKTAVRQLDSL